MTDVIHKVLNDITVDEWAIIIGGDSHTRMSKELRLVQIRYRCASTCYWRSVYANSRISKVTFKGDMKNYMDFRDVVHATQSQMLKQFGGENVFQGRIIEVHLDTYRRSSFTFTDWTAEMKAKASICISEDDTLIKSLEIAQGRIQIMIDKGMDNEKQVLKGLIAIANNRIEEIKSGTKPALTPDANAKYFAEVVIDLDIVAEPMIADQT
jgi:aconitate hydratase 2/2-methylisocitrate dehydratase